MTQENQVLENLRLYNSFWEEQKPKKYWKGTNLVDLSNKNQL